MQLGAVLYSVPLVLTAEAPDIEVAVIVVEVDFVLHLFEQLEVVLVDAIVGDPFEVAPFDVQHSREVGGAG